MSGEIVFYYNPMSRARIAHWMLEEVAVPYRIELLRFDKGDQKKPEYLAVNPMGKVPAIVHRGVVVTEAAAICTYLADAFPKAQLAPPLDDPQRGTYLRWLFFMASNFEAAVLDQAAPRPKSPPSSSLGYGSYADVMHAIESALRPGPYILGERFSAADVYMAAQLEYAAMMKWIEPRPAVEAYLARISARPGKLRAQEQCNALMQQMKSSG